MSQQPERADRPAWLGGEAICVKPASPEWPGPDAAVAAAVAAALADGTWGKYDGGHVRALEADLAAAFGVSHALTCGSGTYAVEVALRALGVGPGDPVVLAAYDYPGNFLSVHALGARPVLVDVNADDWNLSLSALASALTLRPKAVIASHLHGGLVDMPRVRELCREAGVAVVEDAAQAPGASVGGRPAGSWGDAGVLSFGGSKLLSAGRGGGLLTNRADVAQRARLILARGPNAVCPLSELQAAALRPQLVRLPAFHARRTRSVARLQDRLTRSALPGLRLIVPSGNADSPGYYKVGWQYDAGAWCLAREVLTAAARAEGVALDPGFRALHAGRAGSRWQAAGPLTEAGRAGEGALILHHPVLLGSDAQVDEVVEVLVRLFAWRRELAAHSTGG